MFTFSKSIEKSTKKIVFCKSLSKDFRNACEHHKRKVSEYENMLFKLFLYKRLRNTKAPKICFGEKSILSESVKAIAILLNQTFFDITKTCLFIKLSENIGKSYLTNPQQKPYINNEDRISSLFSEPSRFSKWLRVPKVIQILCDLYEKKIFNIFNHIYWSSLNFWV